jgi:hypothetical protein
MSLADYEYSIKMTKERAEKNLMKAESFIGECRKFI